LEQYYGTGYDQFFNQAFTVFPKDLLAPQPNLVEGLFADEFCSFLVNQQLGGAAGLFMDDPRSIPSTLR